jgi:hypothetical protein
MRFPLVVVALDGSRLMLVMGRQKMLKSECYPNLYVVAVIELELSQYLNY